MPMPHLQAMPGSEEYVPMSEKEEADFRCTDMMRP